MAHNKILSKVTLADLKEYAINHDYDWKLEILPNLDEIAVYIDLNTDKRAICSLALGSTVGTPLKRKQAVKEGKVVHDIHQP